MRSQYVSASTRTRDGHRRILFRPGVHELAVARAAAAGRGARPRNADDREVVFDGRDARRARSCGSSDRCRRCSGRAPGSDRERWPASRPAEISSELIGSGTMSSVMPCDATRSRSRVSDSTDHASSIRRDGSSLQMLWTPNAAQARRISSESPCCVPTFIFAFGDVVGATMPELAGDRACCADTTASARAAAGAPAPARRTNSRRFMPDLRSRLGEFLRRTVRGRSP